MNSGNLLEDVYSQIDSFFDTIKDRKCNDPLTFLHERVMYHEIADKEDKIKLMLSSTYSILHVTNEYSIEEPFRGWSLVVVQLFIDKSYQRQGLGTSILKYIKKNTPTQFVIVQSVSKSLESLLIKNSHSLQALKAHNPEVKDWVLRN